MSRARLRLHERLALRGIDLLGTLSGAFRVPFLEAVVAQYGLRGAFARLGKVEQIVAALEAELGDSDSHFVVGFASLYNGCEFCSLGHIYAANLLYFRATGRLHPLDELEIRDHLRVDSDRELLDFSLGRLAAPEHAPLAALLERQHRLKTGELPHPALGTAPADAPTERRDDLLAMAISAYDWLNHCSIRGDDNEIVSLVIPLHRDRALRRRYAAARGR